MLLNKKRCLSTKSTDNKEISSDDSVDENFNKRNSDKENV